MPEAEHHQCTAAQLSSGNRTVTVRNMTCFDSDMLTGKGPERKDHIPNVNSEVLTAVLVCSGPVQASDP